MSIEFNGLNPSNQASLRGKRSEDRPTPQTSVGDTNKEARAPAESTKVSLSNAGQTIQQVEADLKKSGIEIDNQRVEALRTAILDGSYKIDAEKVAQKMLDLE